MIERESEIEVVAEVSKSVKEVVKINAWNEVENGK